MSAVAIALMFFCLVEMIRISTASGSERGFHKEKIADAALAAARGTDSDIS
jgi:hypothetical protein